jgi:hypothetical protein
MPMSLLAESDAAHVQYTLEPWARTRGQCSSMQAMLFMQKAELRIYLWNPYPKTILVQMSPLASSDGDRVRGVLPFAEHW